MADIDRLIGFMAIMQVPFMNDPDALMYIEEVKLALKELQARQPRVLTLEEAKSLDVVWAEDRATSDVYVCPVKNNMNDSKLYKYGIQWRVWSARPTNEQREATPWN